MSEANEPKRRNLVVFLDAVGRTIFGESVEIPATKDDAMSKALANGELHIKNPVIVHISPHPQTGQISLQLFPLFFKEFLADKTQPTVWHYSKANITMSDEMAFDFRLQVQYDQIFTGPPPAPPQNGGQATPEDNRVKLFDDDKKEG